MTENIYNKLEELSLKSKSGNGRLKIVLIDDDDGTSKEIMELNWENICDLNSAMRLLYYCKWNQARLNLPDAHWAEEYKAIGEEVPHTRDKMKFLFDHFVGQFAY